MDELISRAKSQHGERNKYGGINDMPPGWTKDNHRLYALWFGMLRRCYDKTQHERPKGRAYVGCRVCQDWFSLSGFVRDVVRLPGYAEWMAGRSMMLDKDTVIPGNREYRRVACRFIDKRESASEVNHRHPELRCNLGRFQCRPYFIHKGGATIAFESEKSACDFLGVKQCSVASCYMKKRKCKGYTITRGARMDLDHLGDTTAMVEKEDSR